ncbi:hypothetical protein PISMIDRAFT_58357, partial [Pisolithus microcarpus 441]
VSADLGNGYVLLAKRDRYLTAVRGEEERVIAEYLGLPFAPKIRRWARLHLPNGQITRSEYQELQKAPEDIRMSHNVKHAALDADIASPDHFHFADVALVTAYSQPHTDLLEKSYSVLALCTKPAQPSLQVIKISDIWSVITMIPHRPIIHGVAEERYFLVEKSGMEI